MVRANRDSAIAELNGAVENHGVVGLGAILTGQMAVVPRYGLSRLQKTRCWWYASCSCPIIIDRPVIVDLVAA